MRSFITGSVAYATATEDSDLDLVVLVSPDTKNKLKEISDNQGYPIKFGCLNLVCVTSEEEWAAWKLATIRCQNTPAPISKEQAIKIHEHSRKAMGIEEYKGESGNSEDAREARTCRKDKMSQHR